MPILFSLWYNGSLVTWTVVSLTATKCKPPIFSVSVFALSYVANIVIHYFIWPLLIACTILLYNRIHTEGWTPCANLGPVCTLENFQRTLFYRRWNFFVVSDLLASRCLAAARLFIKPFPRNGQSLSSHVTVCCTPTLKRLVASSFLGLYVSLFSLLVAGISIELEHFKY
jgi:hypothetical protein